MRIPFHGCNDETEATDETDCNNKRPVSTSLRLTCPLQNSDVIEVRDLWKTIENPPNRVEILSDVTFTVPRGQFLAIMGASGSGKSTLLGLLAGLDTVTSGRIVLDGMDITNLGEDRFGAAARTKDRVRFSVLPTGADADGGRKHSVAGRVERLRRATARRAQRNCWSGLGLLNRAHHYPVQLSGGEQQRVALARAFITRPPILMADEPTGNLDSANGQHVLDLLLQLNREEKTTLMLVTHDRKLAEYADRIITLSDGQVLERRTSLDVAVRSRSDVFVGTASKIAWRELRAAPAKFLFVILAVAVGVAALSGVKGFGYASRACCCATRSN